MFKIISQFFHERSLAIGFLVLGLIGIVMTSPLFLKIEVEKQSVYVIPPKEMTHFSFGFSEAIASIMWLRLLQDMDICTQSDTKAYNPGQSLDEILTQELPRSMCDEGWVYHMLDRITDFSRNFLYAYSHGGLILSVVVDDREGARKIFDKGLTVFPENYNLNFSAAYHYLLEIRDPKKSAELMLKTYQLGGPAWLPILAARLYAKGGMKEAGITLLSELIEENPDSVFTESAQHRLEEMLQTYP